MSRFCHLKLKFNQHRNCILSPTYNILPGFFFCVCLFLLALLTRAITARVQLQAESQDADFSSTPTAVNRCSPFTAASKAHPEKSQPSRGKLFSRMPGNEIQLHFIAEFKLYNAASLSIYLLCVEGWRERKGKSFYSCHHNKPNTQDLKSQN